jgi:ferredoxin
MTHLGDVVFRHVCTHKAHIRPGTEAGLEKWLGINAEYARVWPNITVKREPPPDAKEWEDKPDKADLLSPNLGTGD